MRRLPLAVLLPIHLAACGGDDVPAGGPDARPAIDGAVLDAALADAPATASDAAPQTGDAAFIPDAGGLPDAPADLLPIIDAVSLDGIPGSTQVRQGERVTLVVTGANLDQVIWATVGDEMLFPAAPGVTELRIDVLIRHGEEPGPRTLTLHGIGVMVSREAALTVTPVVVAIDGDDGGRGTYDAPLRTIDAGLGLALSGDTVEVGPGTFSAGEPPQHFLFSGVALVGAGPAETIVTSPVLPAHGATLRGMRVPCFFDSLLPRSGTTLLEDLDVVGGCARGILLRHRAFLSNVTVSAASTGIAIEAAEAGSYTLIGVNITSGDIGLSIQGPATSGLHGVTIAGTQNIGLAIGVGAQATVRDTTITTGKSPGGRGSAVYVTSTGAVLDFGNGVAAGNNVLSGEIWALEDARPDRATADGPVLTISSSQLGDVELAPGTLTGPTTAGYLRISGENQRVRIY